MSHYNDVIMGAIASQITSLTIVYSTVYSDADQRKHQSTASLGFVLIMSFFIKKFEHIIFFSVLWPKKLHHCILYVRFRAEFRSNLLPINDSLFFIHLSPLIDTSQSFLITITFSASAIGNFHVSLGNDGLEKTAAEFSGPQARQCGQYPGVPVAGSTVRVTCTGSRSCVGSICVYLVQRKGSYDIL